MLKLGITLLGISNLLSATIPTGIFMLMIIAIRHQGFSFETVALILIIFVLEIFKWIAFYKIIKDNNMTWYAYYILYIIPIILVSINNPMYFILILTYILGFLALYFNKKNVVTAS